MGLEEQAARGEWRAPLAEEPSVWVQAVQVGRHVRNRGKPGPSAPAPGWGWMLGEGDPVAHRGMLPVQDDLRDVFHRMQKMIVSPLVPVDSHCAIFIHAARERHGCPHVNRPHLSAALPTSR